ncbi:SIR2 family NAD-dependent protein deacylase [Leeuwenhoekiella nanhaiensis]|uniref:Uncharacterized protein n=1 Tax=Leeuwenhoekiella nanhaiensis TaxID=1655491 RepID=A0A2G1VU70_9FLAO|nr:SIR2 family protein [Leeuwenhoekiella nanhaiensis]PHQ30316.1 hypothetical protein CJ305_04960 [Leeuwenhoekiella nanhaiensis]
MNWPKALTAELASRRCIIFIGSGASAGSISADGTKSPATWNKFLQDLKAKMTTGDKTTVDNLINSEKYLDAAEVILHGVPAADFSAYIREELVRPRYKESSIHESVLDIDPKIVVTTNYDDIYDKYCRQGSAIDGYNICKYYEDHIVSDLRSPVRLILKIHGCVSDPSKIVLSRSQYFREKQDHGNFFKVLEALFLTHTILFLGYSLSDPDIQLILENSSISARSAHPHYIVTGDDLNPAIKESYKRSYNLEFIEFPSGDYKTLNEGINDLKDEVLSYRATYDH